MTHTDVCPNCGEKRYEGEIRCWYCNESFDKHGNRCPTCGQPKDLAKQVADHVREARRA